MKYSIRFKLFSVITGIILIYVILSWLFNTLLLDKYYYYNVRNMLKQSYNAINAIYEGDPEEIALELEKLEKNEGLHIIIQDSNLDIKYNSFGRRREFFFKGSAYMSLPENEAIVKSKADQLLKKGPFIEERRDERVGSNFIRFYGVLNNGDYIILSVPAAAIKESAKIANKFFIFTGLITILTGAVAVFFISGRFLKPILELNEIARRMAVLDFSKRYTKSNEDEIGQLGKSINSLSEQLEKSICDLKAANKKLEEDIKKERQIDEMRRDFISSVSHELKTPIALIQGYAEGLKLNVNKDEENKNFYCDVIIDEAAKMNKLVKQLLELSQLESGQIHLEKVDFNISLFVSKIIKKNELIFKNSGIEPVVTGEENLIVNADIDKIEQVLMNYLNNAINHVDKEKRVAINIKRLENKARVSVYNSGQHIPDESLTKIWTSFYKVDKARTRAYGGTGLGLSIVKAIQEAHGNSCGVRNVEGGVEFWFDLDLSDCTDEI